MDNKQNDLWQGGPWEQPSRPVTPIPAIQLSAARPVLRKRSRRPRRWPWFLAGMLFSALVCVGITAAVRLLPLYGIDLFPSIGQTQPSTPGQTQPPYRGEEKADPDPQPADGGTPPSIPKAATGTGVTLEFGTPRGPVLTYAEIYRKNAPSIVSIQGGSINGISTGTGIVLTADGYILTNAHVVDGMMAVDVILYDNTVYEAALVGFNAREDIAVLKVDATDLTPAEFGDSNYLQVGDPVAAIGDPLGYRSTLTDGIVSALDREVKVEGITMTLIQTNVAINFGNSGGALINQYGQVVGITAVKIVADDGSAEALGFAIPSQRVKFVADRLIAGREVKAGAFGITVYTAPAEGGGLEIQSVVKDADAWAKGLRPGDILVSANGLPINRIQDLTRLKQSRGAGDIVTLMYRRGTTAYVVDVALMDAEDFPE